MKRLYSQRTYRAWLVPYCEGALDPARTAALEARLARDPALAAEEEALRVVTSRLRQSAQGVAADADPRLSLAPIPLWPGVQARLAPPHRALAPRLLWAGGLGAALLVLAVWLMHGPAGPPRQASLPVPVPMHTVDSLPPPRADTPRRVRRAPRPMSRYAHTARRRLQGTGETTPLPRRLLARGKTPEPGDSAPSPSVAVLPEAPPPARPAVQISEGPTRFQLASPLRDAPHTAEPAPPVPEDTPETSGPVSAADGENSAPTGTVRHHQRRRHARRRHGHKDGSAPQSPAVVPAGATPPHPLPAPSHNPAST